MSVTLQQDNERTEAYVPKIEEYCERVLTVTDIPQHILPHFERKQEGKVRDIYLCEHVIVIVTTDRLSAFDRVLTTIPFKGQVLNLLSLWWFEQSKHIVPNYIVYSPHTNVTVGKRCTVFPVEFVMRGYATGSTGTSLWTKYAEGHRTYCGHTLPENMEKNQKLEVNLLTPTTKSEDHDELISAEEIISRGLMTKSNWDTCEAYAQQLFQFGQEIALTKGLILVDTKYEFGLDGDGNVLLVDEVHTPDSSRFWVAESYEEKMARGEDPDNIDKEFIRKWYASQCPGNNPYSEAIAAVGPPPKNMVCELARRYILLYEVMTGQRFDIDMLTSEISLEIALKKCFESSGKMFRGN